MSTLGLDLGKRRIGVAVFDLPGMGARPLTTLLRSSWSRDIEQIRTLVQDRQARRIVVGLPINMNGSEGPAARDARRFAALLSRELGLPVELYDERLTSFEAESRLRDSSVSRNSRKLMVDQIAAALILESWLAAHANDETV
jgi:putative Holliday junction resolvase